MFAPHTGSQWVGAMFVDDRPEFIHLTVQAERGAALDRPNSFQFQLPLVDLQIADLAARFSAGPLRFEGMSDQDRFAGSVQEGTRSGGFTLQPVRPLAPGEYAGLLGHYRLGPEREIAVSQDDRTDLQLYFYVDGDQVVRLHPIGSQRFLSERCETITFDLDGSGNARALTWQAHGHEPAEAARVVWGDEAQVRIPVADYVLAGTLLLPPGDPPHPAVMLCHHADTHQRDYYRLFAEAFLRRGIAALIYDKRGSGDSTGAQLFSEIFQLADDAAAVFRFLQRHSAIRPDAVGLWGISNGAWVAPLTASRVGDAAFVIGASGAGVTPARQEQIRRANVAQALGASPRAVALIDRLWERLFKFFVDGQWNEEVESILEQVYADEELQRLPKHPEHGPSLQPVPPVYPIEQIKAQEGGTWEDGGFDPAPVYAGLRCPILCVWGQADTVLPLEEGMRRIEQALQAGDHSNYQLHVLPDATHKLYAVSPAPAGVLAEVMHTQLHNVSLAPGVRELMADWAHGTLAADRKIRTTSKSRR